MRVLHRIRLAVGYVWLLVVTLWVTDISWDTGHQPYLKLAVAVVVDGLLVHGVHRIGRRVASEPARALPGPERQHVSGPPSHRSDRWWWGVYLGTPLVFGLLLGGIDHAWEYRQHIDAKIVVASVLTLAVVACGTLRLHARRHAGGRSGT